jgi:hypothetical protein
LLAAGNAANWRAMAINKCGQLFYNGSLSVDGYPKIQVLESNFEAKCRANLVATTLETIKEHCPNMSTIVMDGIVPKILPTLSKWCSHPAVGEEITKTVRTHEQKWKQSAAQTQNQAANNESAVTAGAVVPSPAPSPAGQTAPDSSQASSVRAGCASPVSTISDIKGRAVIGATMCELLFTTSAIYIANNGASTVKFTEGTCLTGWGSVARRLASDDQEKQLAQGEKFNM